MQNVCIRAPFALRFCVSALRAVASDFSRAQESEHAVALKRVKSVKKMTKVTRATPCHAIPWAPLLRIHPTHRLSCWSRSSLTTWTGQLGSRRSRDSVRAAWKR